MKRYRSLAAAGCVVMVVGVIVLFLEPAEYFFGDGTLYAGDVQGKRAQKFVLTGAIPAPAVVNYERSK